MKAPLLFIIVFMIHVMGISGFVLMQGCATRQPLDGPRSNTPPVANTRVETRSNTTVQPNTPVFPPRRGASVADAPRSEIKEYIPPAPRNIAPPSTPSVPVKSADSPIVKVKKGDSLSKIAKRHGLSSKELAAFNGINNPNKIRIGQKIYLPGNARNALSSPSKPAVRKPTSVKRRVSSGDYVVRAGDSLSKIAVKNGTTVKALKQTNGLTSDRILVGQALALPGGASKPVARKFITRKPAVTALKKSASTPRVETISITPVAPQRAVLKTPVKSAAPVAIKETAPRVDTSVIDQSFEYTVQEGETLRDISNAFIVSSEDILKINNLNSEQDIRSGMKLKIPPSEF